MLESGLEVMQIKKIGWRGGLVAGLQWTASCGGFSCTHRVRPLPLQLV